MDYSLYEPEDFAANESYLRYYFKLDPADILFWQNWISNHPEKLDVIISADQLIGFASLHLPEEEYQQEIERLHKAIETFAPQQVSPPAPIASTRRRLPRMFAMAAVVVMLLVAITFIIRPDRYPLKGNHRDLIADNMLEKRNNGATPLTIHLDDHSTVILQTGARLLYPRQFTKGKREVYLDGEAFFDISHDADRPFYVYYNHLVTHVLGTSFTIKTNALAKQIEVAVRSGKVEVYENTTSRSKPDLTTASNGVILTPNQKVVYLEDSRRFEALLVDEPLPLLSAATTADSLQVSDPVLTAADFVFNTAPLPEVLQVFEKVYGIEIEVENTRINNCHFSGDMANMGFNARLEAICQVLHTTYEIRGTKILIRGNGCPA
jgi:transmembrane sensor